MYCIHIVILILHGLSLVLDQLSLTSGLRLEYMSATPQLYCATADQHPSVVSEKSWDTKDDKIKYMIICKRHLTVS